MPHVTVILPVYNTEKYIAEAVQSILNQTFSDFELLVINDASTDRTLEVLNRFSDNRLKIITNPTNLKVVKSLNKGLELAKGEFIARMDADDISHPQRFKRQIEYFNDHPEVDLCGSWVQMIGDDNYILTLPEKHETIKADMLFKNIIVHPSVMFRKEKLSGFRYDETYINAEDYALWVEVMDKVRFGIIPEVLLKYRVHHSNVSIHRPHNAAVIKEMNYKTYSKLLQRLGVGYTEENLKFHISLGFRRKKDFDKLQLKDYISWMQRLVAANNKSRYFDKKALRNAILNNIIFLVKKKRWSISNYLVMVKALFTLYTLVEYLDFMKFKKDLKRITLERLRLSNVEGIEYR